MKTIKADNVFELPYNFTGIVEFPNGTKFWYVDEKLRRTDGPACEFPDGTKEYWVIDKQFTKEAHDLFYNLMKLKSLAK